MLQGIQCELTYTQVLEKFLSYASKGDDVARLMTAFSNIFAQFEDEFSELGARKGKGFFQIPVHRLFAHLITRLLLKDLIMRGEEATDLAEIEPNFQDVLEKYIDTDLINQMFRDVLAHFAVNMGYVAEISCGKWVYKGEQFKTVSNVYRSSYAEMYLKGIAIYQMAICTGTDQNPGSNYVDILLNNFGTDDWMQTFLESLTLGSAEAGTALVPERFLGKANFQVDKLANQVQ